MYKRCCFFAHLAALESSQKLPHDSLFRAQSPHLYTAEGMTRFCHSMSSREGRTPVTKDLARLDLRQYQEL